MRIVYGGEKKKKDECQECQCESAGYCPMYGIKMTPRLHCLCKNDKIWRDNFKNFFKPPQDEVSVKAREAQALESKMMREHGQQLDEVITQVEEAGISVEDNATEHEGLGDLLGSVFGRLGITEEAIEKWAGLGGGCGCSKRKKFLNKILPFRKSEPSIAPKKEES
jgi:hypothetical protein